MQNAFISGTGFYVPPRVVTNDDLIKMGIDTTHEWIHQRTGIESRRFAEEGVGRTTRNASVKVRRRYMGASDDRSVRTAGAK